MAYVPPHRRKPPGEAAPPARGSAAAPAGNGSRRTASHGGWRPPASQPLRCLCHQRYQLFPGGPHALSLDRATECSAQSLLGGVDQFCAAFYHIEPTAEADEPELCLGAAAGCEPCPRKTVCCVARLLGGGGEELHVGRYVNCFRGHGTTNLHAEHFLTRDPVLERAVQSLSEGGGGGRLVLYLTYQPCHNSGGHDEATMGAEYTSCTQLLLRYHEALLAPRAIELHIKVAYVYRAHWREGLFPPKYASVVASARVGLGLLGARRGVRIEALEAGDWSLLAALADERVASEYALGDASAVFTPAVRAARARMDAFVGETISSCCREISDGRSDGEPPPAAAAVEGSAAEEGSGPARSELGAPLDRRAPEAAAVGSGLASLALSDTS